MEISFFNTTTFLPTLYKKTSTGAIQQWTIEVTKNVIRTEHGQIEGKMQVSTDTIKAGKNVGKVNGTIPETQAMAEAKAKWEKQKKKGYVETIEAAQAEEVDEIIEGGILPMLAFTFEKQGKKIKYPCFVQPKLDGIRCIAILKDGTCTLWSRTRKPITSCPHIIAEIERIFRDDIVLDGELYNHDLKKDFEQIVSKVRQEEPEEGHEIVQYHVYDIVNTEIFRDRSSKLHKCFKIGPPDFKYLKLVETQIVNKEEEVSDWFSEFSGKGYEGAILRNGLGLYANKRSSDLIKVKEMQDAEFAIVGIQEGRGKLAGHVGSFICNTNSTVPQEFNVKLMGDTSKLKEYFEDSKLWFGKVLTVKFQDYTSYEIPRFPVGVRIREDV